MDDQTSNHSRPSDWKLSTAEASGVVAGASSEITGTSSEAVKTSVHAPRVRQACVRCQKGKKKCDRARPCARCEALGHSCADQPGKKEARSQFTGEALPFTNKLGVRDQNSVEYIWIDWVIEIPSKGWILTTLQMSTPWSIPIMGRTADEIKDDLVYRIDDCSNEDDLRRVIESRLSGWLQGVKDLKSEYMFEIPLNLGPEGSEAQNLRIFTQGMSTKPCWWYRAWHKACYSAILRCPWTNPAFFPSPLSFCDRFREELRSRENAAGNARGWRAICGVEGSTPPSSHESRHLETGYTGCLWIRDEPLTSTRSQQRPDSRPLPVFPPPAHQGGSRSGTIRPERDLWCDSAAEPRHPDEPLVKCGDESEDSEDEPEEDIRFSLPGLKPIFVVVPARQS